MVIVNQQISKEIAFITMQVSKILWFSPIWINIYFQIKQDLSLAISCPSSANVNQTIKCTLTAQKSTPIGSLVINVDFGDNTYSNLTFVSMTSSFTINKSYNTSGSYVLTANILEYLLDVNCIVESIFKKKLFFFNLK